METKTQQNIIDKIYSGYDIPFYEWVSLYELDLFKLAKIANDKRESIHGKKTFFNINRHINPTNICKDFCQFCAFSASRKNPNPYTMSIENIINILKKSVDNGVDEVHVVSAHNKRVGFEWYMNIIKNIRENFPNIHIKAFSAAEVHFLAKEFNKSYEYVLDNMIESGVDSMPGGGAEIFDEGIRYKICRGKVSSKEWLLIHKLWHNRGKKSNVTMLFGHIEKRNHRIDHILRVKRLQDETGGFNAFIHLLYQRENNYLRVDKRITSHEILKNVAISRMMLDNIPHIKSYWATMGINLALVSQSFGADDLDGTIEKESIVSSAGAKSSSGMKLEEIVSMIKGSGYIPTQRDSMYNIIKTW